MNNSTLLKEPISKGLAKTPRGKMLKSFLRATCCYLLSVAIVGCGQSPEAARKELAALKKDYTALEFIASAMDGDKMAASLFLRSGMDVNTTEENGVTALMAATLKKHSEIVALLLDHGAKPDVKCDMGDQRGATPLLAGINARSEGIVSLLLKNKADPNLASDRDMTPLMLASAVGDVKMVLLLLEAGAKVNTTDARGQTALLDAAGRQHSEVVSLLLKNGANIKAESKAGETAFDAALGETGIALLGLVGTNAWEMKASAQQKETVRILRQAGVKPVSRFFTANVYKGVDEVMLMRVLNTKDAKNAREFIVNLLNNFKSIGFNETQMTEARAQVVKSLTRARARLGIASLTEATVEEKALDQDFINLTKEFMDETDKRQHLDNR